jgi:SAM-dependent methyltransferase
MATKNQVTRGTGLLENYLARKRANFARKLILDGVKRERILDIGCGYYPFFLENLKFKQKYGIDPNTDGSLIKDKSIQLKKIDVEKQKLPFKNDFFDAITMLAVFEHINNSKLEFVLREIQRVLKKNGIFIISTPSPWADGLLHFMGKVGLISKDEIEDHKHNHSDEKINLLLEKSGFKKDNIRNGFFELGMNMWFYAKK